VSGRLYRFRVFAVNFNGNSEASEIASYYSCNAPSGLDTAHIVSQSSSEVDIEWQAPSDNGGCRITTYIVYRDDGMGGEINVEVNESNDPQVFELASTNSLTVTNFPVSTEGFTFRFQIKVVTTQREATSKIVFIMLAGVPS
jgi:hypothetical protein